MKKTAVLSLIILLCGAIAVHAETVFLKDGTIVRGKIVQDSEDSIIIETADSWQRIDRSSIDHIGNDDMPSPSAAQLPTAVTAEASSTPAGEFRRSSRREDSGLYLGFQLPYNMIGGDFDGINGPEVDPGLGFGIILGYRFTPQFGMEIDWSGSGHNSEGADIGFGEFSLNAKISFAPETQAHPFLFAGVGSFVLGDSSLTFGGSGYNLGAGVDVQVSKQNTLGIALIQKFITYDEIVESDTPLILIGEINGDTTSIRFDFTHQF